MFIKTERLTLKPYSNNDKEAMIDLLTNNTIKKTFMIVPYQYVEMQECNQLNIYVSISI